MYTNQQGSITVQFVKEQVLVFEAAIKVPSFNNEFVQVFEAGDLLQLEGQIINIGDTYWDMFIRVNNVLYRIQSTSMYEVKRV